MLNCIRSAIVGAIIIFLMEYKGLSQDATYICFCISYFLFLIYLELQDFKKEKNK